MTTGRKRRSSSQLMKRRQKRVSRQKLGARRALQLESLEDRRLLALGPQLIGVQPNGGDLLAEGDIRNVAPQELTFRFNEGQIIDEATLDAIQVTRAGGDGQFVAASTRTDFNTNGLVVMQFTAVAPGPLGNEISLVISKSDPGGARLPRIQVDGREIYIELNANAQHRSTAANLVQAINNHEAARALIEPSVVAGSASTQISIPQINYSPVRLTGANIARASTNFNAGNVDVQFTAVQSGPEANGIAIEFARVDRGGAGDPVIRVLDSRRIRIELNSNMGNQTTAGQLVSALNAHPTASALVTATLRVGAATRNIAAGQVTYSPLVLSGADDVPVQPAFVGLGSTPQEVIFRFAEPLPDDLYRIDIAGTGSNPLRNTAGFALGDSTDNGIDDGIDFSLGFRLDLGARVLAVVPQPVVRSQAGTLTQALNRIEVYLNDDDLDPASATNPDFYKLIYTNDSATPHDDLVFSPTAVEYSAAADRVRLTFAAPLHELVPAGGTGSFRLRIGTNEAVGSSDPDNQAARPELLDLRDVNVGSTLDSAYDLSPGAGDALTGSYLISSAIRPQVDPIALPGSSDEPGFRRLPLGSTGSSSMAPAPPAMADANNGITTLFYNFRSDYGTDPEGNPLTNLISDDQRQRAREAFEVWGRSLGVQFVETATQGFTIATGDMRVIDPELTSARGDAWVIAYESQPLSNDLRLVLDASEDWYDGFGPSDSPLRESWFESAVRGIGFLLGLQATDHLPPGTWLGSDPMLGFDQPVEPVYPGDQDVVQGQRAYRPNGQDVDLYRFEIGKTGLFTAETIAERQQNASLLDTHLKLYRLVDQTGEVELVAVNDDFYGSDSYLELVLDPGTYFVGVSSKGNEDYRPDVAGSGYGGITEGAYDLRLNFRPDAFSSIKDTTGTPLDGNGDGLPGGAFNFWFRVDPATIFVDKVAPAGGNGSLTAPFNNLVTAMNQAKAVASQDSPRVVRILGNGGADGLLQTPEDARPYEIGFNHLGQTLSDGARLEVPQGVTVMIDQGAVFKLRRGYVDVGSSSPSIDRSGGALQVLGTPRLIDAAGNVIRDALGRPLPGSVFFTSYDDENLGGDSNPSLAQTPKAGDWGGMIFRNRLDRSLPERINLEAGGTFLNTINFADIRYGGGTVLIDGQPRTIAPIYTVSARPTITNNSIMHSADVAISMNPDSFEETNFHAPRYQGDGDPFTSDYTRIGPDVRGNRLIDNSINGLFVRTKTTPGGALEQMTVSGRWNNTDIVHVVAEPLRIAGSPGGPIQRANAPDATLVRLQTQTANAALPQLPAGTVDYRLTFVDAQGNETAASDPTESTLIRVINEDAGVTQRVLLTNLPAVPSDFSSLRIYRSIKSEYGLIAELSRATLQAANYRFTDQVAEPGQIWLGSDAFLEGRPAGRLMIDPGTVVKLNGGTIETSFGSQLIAEGVPGRQVVFTSLLDHRYGAGGTFETSGIGEVEPGGWAGLYAGPIGQMSLDHAVVAYGGGIAEIPGAFSGFNAVEIQQAKARVTNSVFEFNDGGDRGLAQSNRAGRSSNAAGVIFVRGSQPVLVDNVIRDNSGPAISINVNALNWEPVSDHGRSTGLADVQTQLVDNRGPLIRGNRLGNNDINGMQVRGGTLTTQGVWDDTDIVHVVLDDTIYIPDFQTFGGLRLQSSSQESLVVKLYGEDAGIVATGRPLDVTDRIGGMLHVIGQPGYPVIVTSLRDDTAAAGFTPEGRPQGDTNNDGDAPGLGTTRPRLPTVPDIIDPDEDPEEDLFIHNNVPESVPGRFGMTPGPAGSSRFSDLVTAQGLTQLFEDVSFVYDFLNYVDVGIDGQAIDLAATIDGEPELTGPNEVTSTGTFEGPNGDIDWEVRTFFIPGFATLHNEVTFSSSEEFGNLRFINYLDQDILGPNDDLLFVSGAPGTPNFEVYTLDNAERIGFSQSGVYAPSDGLVNATWDGWAADQFPLLKNTITGAGTTFSENGNINTAALTPFNDPDLGIVYGLADVTTAFAWTLNPGATEATVTTFLNLILEDPTIDTAPQNFAGDWQSVRLEQFAHDRNVEIVLELESSPGLQAGNNETPSTAQHLGTLAPHEKAADENRRLGFEVHGSLNRPGDVDVFSFEGTAGTEVWLDIDRTSRALDTVLELVDSDGTVLARSISSFAEAADPSQLYARTLSNGEPAVHVQPLNKSPFISQDHWSTNPADAGMRLMLPGPADSTNTYFVRVRSNSGNLGDVNAGKTMGVYQLQVRLRELDELPGTTIRMADIRYATNGIELIGQPYHSPLLGEAAEIVDPSQPTNDNNNTPADAQDLGNLLATDRGTISVAGELFTDDDVDWYRFRVEYGPLPGDLTRGTWDITGTLADVDWEGSTLVFQSQTPRGADESVSGYFDWVADGAFAGRELFSGTVFADGTMQLTGTQLIDAPQLTLGVYTAALSADRTSIADGTRGPVPTGLPLAEGSWAADQVIPVADVPLSPQYAALVFDIDYADGLARANTNLWVFDDQARLVLMGGDSNTPDDRPVGGSTGTQDLSRGSVGAKDPFIGTVQMPATGLAPGVYHVAVSSNAVIPAELEQFLMPAVDNPLVRLEPINSVQRIAEDRIDAIGTYSTAEAPKIPVLFGADNQATLFSPGGHGLVDGETFTITSANGQQVVYEFDRNGQVRPGNIPIPFELGFTSQEVAASVVETIRNNPLPAGTILALPGTDLADGETFTITDQGGPRTFEYDSNGIVTPGNIRVPIQRSFTAEQVATAIAESIRGNPPLAVEARDAEDLLSFEPQVVNISTWLVQAGDHGEVTLREHVIRRTLLTTITRLTTDPDDADLTIIRSEPIVRDTQHQTAPALRQMAAPGETQTRVYASLPAAVPFDLNDVSLFVVEPGLRDREGLPLTDNRNDLIVLDPMTGQLITRVGSLGWNVGDIAMLDAIGPDPADPFPSGLYGYSIIEPRLDGQPPEIQTTDVNTGGYVHIDPSSTTLLQIGTDLVLDLGSLAGTSDIETYVADAANPAIPIRIDDGVGVLLQAMAFSNAEGTDQVRGFAIGDRGDVNDLLTGVAKRQNLIFEFDPRTGTVFPDAPQVNLNESGTNKLDLGTLLSTFDIFPESGFTTTITGIDATLLDASGRTQFSIGDTDFFHVLPGADEPRVLFEFDAGFDYLIEVLADREGFDPANPKVIFDGDSFEISTPAGPRFFEFSTGSVVWIFPGATGQNLVDVARFANLEAFLLDIEIMPIPGGASNVNPGVKTFEFVPATLQPIVPFATPIELQPADNQGVIVDSIVSAINEWGATLVGGSVVAEELTAPAGGTGRISLEWVDQPGVGAETLFEIRAEFRQVRWNPDLQQIIELPLPDPPTGFTIEGAVGVSPGAIPVYVEETSTGAEIGRAIARAIRTDPNIEPLMQVGAFGDRINFQDVLNVDFNNFRYEPLDPDDVIFTNVGTPGGSIGARLIPFLADDNAVRIAERVQAALELAGIPSTRDGSLVILVDADASFFCEFSVTGTPHCPLPVGTPAPGGSMTGMAFIGPQLYSVTDTGGLFRIVDRGTGQQFQPDVTDDPNTINVLDYVDGSQKRLMQENPLPIPVEYLALGLEFSEEFRTITIREPVNEIDPFYRLDETTAQLIPRFVVGGNLLVAGSESNDVDSLEDSYTIASISPPALVSLNGEEVTEIVITLDREDSLTEETVPDTETITLQQTHQPVRFTGLVGGPANAEFGRYENVLFGMSDSGRLFAFDTFGNPQPLFANSGTFVDTGIANARGLAFASLDANLWHTTTNRDLDEGHGIAESFDGSRSAVDGNASLYFGYEGPLQQPQFGTGSFATATEAFSYNFVGGAHGSLVSNPFSMQGYSPADKPTLYFNYFLETEHSDEDATQSLPMTDAFRVYIAGNDGRWKLLSTNNSVRSPGNNDDEFDPFPAINPKTGASENEQPFTRAETFDVAQWRQARIDLSPYAGQDDLRLRFEFDTAGGRSSGGRDLELDLNSAGNHLRAIPGWELHDGQQFTLTDMVEDPLTGLLRRDVVLVFEVDLGPTLVAPTGAAIGDGALLTVDGKVYEFDNDGVVGQTNDTPHVPIPFVGTETAGELAGIIYRVMLDSPPPTIDPAGSQWVANRVNLPGAGQVVVSGLPESFVEGQGGVSDSAEDSRGREVPVVPVPVHAGMSRLHVADAIRTALANRLGNGNIDAIKMRQESVQILRYGVGDPGPFGLSGPSDLATAIAGSGLFGDRFGAFDASTDVGGVYDPIDHPGALGMRNNLFEGVYIDDIIIGFAARGEMVTGTVQPVVDDDDDDDDENGLGLFVANTAQPPNEINRGRYQLEIRQATSYGTPVAGDDTTLVLDASFDVNDRLAEGISMTVGDGSVFSDGQTFTIRGTETIVFEFDDLTASNGIDPAHVAIPFHPGDSAVAMARRIRDMLNQPSIQQRLQLRVTTSDGVVSGIASTSNRLHLYGDVSVIAGLVGEGPTGNVPVRESNDTLEEAVETGIVPGGRLSYFATGFIGDNPDPALPGLAADVDLFKVELSAGEALSIDLAASVIGSPLDTLLRVFHADGSPVMTVDEFDRPVPLESDDDLRPGERLSDSGSLPHRDSYLNFVAPEDGVYYIGVSAFGNGAYDPSLPPGTPGSNRQVARTTGRYEIRIERSLKSPGLVVEQYRRQGDQNLHRDQGQMFIHSNRISSTLENGILIDAGIRGRDGMPQPGPVRNLLTANTANLAPGVSIFNNIIHVSDGAGIRYTGHPSADGVAEATGVIPFGRIVNNTIVGTMADSDDPIEFEVKALPGLLGGFNPATTVFLADLSLLTTTPISSLTITDNSFDLVDEFGPLSGMGAISGLDLDAVKLSTALATHASQVPGLPALDVFDFSPSGTILNAGTQVGPVAFELFGTSGGFVDNEVATLGEFDAEAAPGSATDGFVSLGEGGSITFLFDPPLVVTSPLYLYIGEADDVGEIDAGSIQVTNAESPRGQGIVLENNVSPTLLNNVFSTLEEGIVLDASTSTAVVGGGVYHNNTTDAIGTGLGSHPIVAEPTTRLFVDPDSGNFYPSPGSPLIDSSVDSLEERPQMRQVLHPLGITDSPILAPNFDASGQWRVDDPTVSPPPGMGQNIFKDRGAQERADFQGPHSYLIQPLDNGPDDVDRSPTRVNVVNATPNHFDIQLIDREGPLVGIGIDDSTVTKNTVRVFHNAQLLTEGRDYLFGYNPTNNTIRLTPLAGVWQQDSSYQIELIGGAQQVIFTRSGDKLLDGEQFQLTDQSGVATTFEYDSGYVMQIPQTLALQVPAAGGGPGGVADGDTITVSTPTRTVTLEFDNNGVVTPGRRAIPFTAFSTRGEIADAIVTQLNLAGVQLLPVNVGNGKVHLGVNGTQSMTVVSDTIVPMGVQNGVFNGQTFSIDNGNRVVTFEFNTVGGVAPNRVPINYHLSQTHEQLAQIVATAINAQNLGLNVSQVGDGTIHVGGGLNHIVRILNANIELTGQPGAQQAFGFRIPSVAGSIVNQIVDGRTFQISNGAGTTVTFEFDNNNRITPGNVAIPFLGTTTASQLANTMVNQIRATNLGLFPFNAGNGIVILGGASNHSLDVMNSNLTQVGVPGQDAAVRIPFTPAASFTGEMVAAETARVINAQNIPGLSALVEQDQVRVSGATSGSGSSVGFVEGIRDLAGNSLAGNQPDGSTRFTVFLGVGMSYGDAPAPYPTLQIEDGARHVVVDGFSLGTTVTMTGDGLPSDNADAIEGHDGVFFNANQPLIPNRPYTIRISATGNDCTDHAICVLVSGVGSAVEGPAYLDAWIDWNGNGRWGTGDHVLQSVELTAENLANGITLNRVVPPGAVSGETFARFRLSTQTSLTPTGEAAAGEVEDHLVTITGNPWQNPVNRFDVSGDNVISPVDVLLVINYLNDPSNDPSQRLPAVRPLDQPFLDVDGSGFVTPSDALAVINHLNSLQQTSGGEGEAPRESRLRSSSSDRNHLDDVLAADEGWWDILGDVDQARNGMNERDAVFASM